MYVDPSTLHIYSQRMPHCDSFIAGNEQSLRELIAAINHAIDHHSGRAEVCTADGEGYFTIVICDEPAVEHSQLPYSHESFQYGNEELTPPHKLISKEEYKKLLLIDE